MVETPAPGSARRATAATLALLALVAIVGTGLRWWDPWDSRATFDSQQYARVAYRFEGRSAHEAVTASIRLRCQEWAHVRSPAPGWVTVSVPKPSHRYTGQCADPGAVGRSNPTYEAIFAARPGYPLAVAALTPVIGDRAFAVVALGSAALAVLLAGVAALLLGLGRLGGVVAEIAVLALPTGLYLTRIGPDGLVGVGVATALCGALLAVGHRRLGWGVGLLAAGLVLLVPVKQPVAIALGAGLALAAACGAVRPGRTRRPAAVVAAVSAAGAALAAAVGALLGWAGLTTTVQDLATAHFSRPGIAHPYRHLVHADNVLITTSAAHHRAIVVVLLLAVVALVGLARRGLLGLLVLAAGASGLVMIAVHPVATEAARLALPSWYAVALGLASLVSGRRPEPEPAVG